MTVSEVCTVSEVLCSVSDGHYTESGNCSISDEEKGEVLSVRTSHILVKGDTSMKCPSCILLN
jgi:hypothetical protein